jgi:hypothetical protein
MAIFKLRPVVYCDSCPLALTYVTQPDKRILLWHQGSRCPRAFQMFESPEIEMKELKQVRTALHPQVS